LRRYRPAAWRGSLPGLGKNTNRLLPTVEELEGRLTPSYVVTRFFYFTDPPHALPFPPTPKKATRQPKKKSIGQG